MTRMYITMAPYQFYAVMSVLLMIGFVFGIVLVRLSAIVRKLDLIIRKLNNSQPDDTGGY